MLLLFYVSLLVAVVSFIVFTAKYISNKGKKTEELIKAKRHLTDGFRFAALCAGGYFIIATLGSIFYVIIGKSFYAFFQNINDEGEKESFFWTYRFSFFCTAIFLFLFKISGGNFKYLIIAEKENPENNQ